jgi:hypothetical protein
MRVTDHHLLSNLPVRCSRPRLQSFDDQIALQFRRQMPAMRIERERDGVGIAAIDMIKVNSIA